VLRRIFGPKRDEVTGGWRKLHNISRNIPVRCLASSLADAFLQLIIGLIGVFCF
jgi:hypothetical protein